MMDADCFDDSAVARVSRTRSAGSPVRLSWSITVAATSVRLAKMPRTAMPTRSNGNSDRKAARVM